ncbi:MAG: hypothetical protein JWQ07_3215 [Ramlibacter sp.]|nr:hypothetical protein [Ramlibacter sp.]
MDGAKSLYEAYVKAQPEAPPFDDWAPDLHLLLTVLMVEIGHQKKSVGDVLDAAVAEFRVLLSINDPSHMRTATRLMLEHKHVFFSAEATTVLEGHDNEAKRAVLDKAQPYVKLTWHLCVLLCRELVTGEHALTPKDSLMLGLVDEVPGEDLIESRRAFVSGMEARLKPSAKARRLKAGRLRRLG